MCRAMCAVPVKRSELCCFVDNVSGGVNIDNGSLRTFSLLVVAAVRYGGTFDVPVPKSFECGRDARRLVGFVVVIGKKALR